MNKTVSVNIELEVYEEHIFRVIRAIGSPPPYTHPPKAPPPPGDSSQEDDVTDDVMLESANVIFHPCIQLELPRPGEDLLHNNGEKLKKMHAKLASAQLVLTVWAQELNNLIQSLPPITTTRPEL